ncbi:sugar phosphate isomerase/epimerase family protein [Thalassotalea atypica]|uniref:sugar phosphate isomerase/epimerase family protein n=1 Tax=Thalassotalea atypica TaxID=2054316 RepID=UPI00257302AE|nr:sugar phosphate isomerase/epimerase [Thalassotalea atypica]
MKLARLMILGAILLSMTTVANAKQEYTAMPQISVQLWSVKEDVKADFTGTLSALANMGFTGVEFANEFGEFSGDAAAVKRVLDQLGLKGSGAHISFEQLNDKNFDETIAFYQTLGVDMLIVGWDERAWHPEGIKEVVFLLNKLAKKLEPFGIKTGFHNHDHEFNAYNNSTYWDYLAQHTSHNVVLQQDVGWTTYAGKDPIDYVKRYPGRTITTHYKVKLPKGVTGKLPFIGQDTIDWVGLSKTNIAVGGTRWFVVEQEEYPNGISPLEAVKISKQGLDKILNKL